MPKTRKFVLIEPGQTPLTAPEIIAKLQTGVPLDDAAKWIGVSSSHLRRFLKAAGYTTKPQPSLWVEKGDEDAERGEGSPPQPDLPAE